MENYCNICAEEEKKVCPHRRQTSRERPLLQNNTISAAIMDMKKTKDLCYAGPDDVACDVCTGRKLKAHKSCLLCLVSYCKEHLQPHLEELAFKRHNLIHPSKQLQEIICPQHDEEKKMFCRTDQQLICSLCAMDQHKKHCNVSAATERSEREKEVVQSRGDIKQRIQRREVEVELLQQEEKNIEISANETVKTSQEALDQHIEMSMQRMSDLVQKIISQQQTEAARVRRLQENRKQEIVELKKKDAELQELMNTESHTVFLQNLPSISKISEDKVFSTHDSPHSRFEEATTAVNVCREKLQGLLTDTCTNISQVLRPNPQTREEFLRYSQDITLDPSTADSFLILSDGNRKVTNTWKVQPLPPHPGRFTDCYQVLNKEPLAGRCYWEVKRTGYIEVAVSYKSIKRSGEERLFGHNEKSCCLCCNYFGCSISNNKVKTKVSRVWPSTVGVYLDQAAGLLSFYSVAEDMTLLHQVQITFTSPVYAGVRVWNECEFVKLK